MSRFDIQKPHEEPYEGSEEYAQLNRVMARDSSPLEQANNSQQRLLSELEMGIQLLTERLQPLMPSLTDEPRREEPDVTSLGSSEVVRSFGENNRRLIRLVQQVNEVIQELEV